MSHKVKLGRPLLAVAVVVTLGLVACSAPSEVVPTTSSTSLPPQHEAESVATDELVNGEWAQELWLFESFVTVDDSGVQVDLTDDVVLGLPAPTASLALPQDAWFHEIPSLQPAILQANGTARADIETVAGLLEYDGISALAVLATPLPTALGPVALTDYVSFDLTYLGAALAPGDPLILDYARLQTLPTANEPVANGAELLKMRIENDRAWYLGMELDGEQIPMAYTDVLTSAIAGSTKVKTPASRSISEPGLKGIRDGAAKCIGKTPLGCVKNYFKSAAKGAKESNDLIACALDSTCDEQPPQRNTPQQNHEKQKAEIPWCTVGCTPTDTPARVQGDPHLVTLDGHRYQMQGVGEYVLARTDYLELQARTAALTPDNKRVSGMNMVALRLAEQVISISVTESTFEIHLNGNLVETDFSKQNSALPITVIPAGDLEIHVEPRQVVIAAPELEVGVVAVNSFADWLDLALYLPPTDSPTQGLLGNYDGSRDNDFITRSGTTLPKSATEAEIYDEFVESWRVTPAESLLHYLPGENTDTFTDRSFPDLTAPAVSATDLQKAESLCAIAGITDPDQLEICIFDYAHSGEIGFVESARIQQELPAWIATLNAAMDRMLAGEGEASTMPASGNTLRPTDPWAYTPINEPEDAIVRLECPPNGTFHRIWGGTEGLYTHDSSACTAAVHAGIIAHDAGGTILIIRSPGLSDYGPGIWANGVESLPWADWPGSFSVAGEDW